MAAGFAELIASSGVLNNRHLLTGIQDSRCRRVDLVSDFLLLPERQSIAGWGMITVGGVNDFEFYS